MTRLSKRLGYIRTSTNQQSPARQIDGLQGVCDEVFIEHGVSACADHRPIYDAVIAKLHPGDTLVVWDVDRAYRSVIDALTEVRNLSARGVGFEALSGDYDLTTPEGGFIFTLRAALSEWEREKLRRRTREGMAAAKKRGAKIGRPRKLSKTDIAYIKTKVKSDAKLIKVMAKRFQVNPRTIKRALE